MWFRLFDESQGDGDGGGGQFGRRGGRELRPGKRKRGGTRGGLFKYDGGGALAEAVGYIDFEPGGPEERVDLSEGDTPGEVAHCHRSPGRSGRVVLVVHLGRAGRSGGRRRGSTGGDRRHRARTHVVGAVAGGEDHKGDPQQSLWRVIIQSKSSILLSHKTPEFPSRVPYIYLIYLFPYSLYYILIYYINIPYT